MNLRSSLPAIFLASALTLTGCKPDAAIRKGEPVGSGISQQPTAATQPAAPVLPAVGASQFGTITGVVNFTGRPPARVPIDMSMDPACSLVKAPNLSEQYVVTAGKLGNVYIYVKTGAPASKAPANTPPVVMDQQGCQYLPHVAAVQQGGTVEFHNSDPTMHNIHTTPADGSSSVDVSQGPNGAPKSQVFNTVETMLPVRCNNHPWMNAFLNVAPNPYFAITGADGKFTLHLPPGTYTVAALHEKLGEQDITVTVPAKSSAKANFTYTAK